MLDSLKLYWTWVELRQKLWKPQLRFSAFAYPILGQYIIALDHYVLDSIRVEIYILYFSFLILSLTVLFFGLICPLPFRDFNSQDDFLTEFRETDYNILKLERLEAKLNIEKNSNANSWQERKKNIWDEATIYGQLNLKILSNLLKLSIALFSIASIISIYRVFSTIL